MPAAIDNLPWAVRDGKHFRIAGRKGQWKYFEGRKRPESLRARQKFHLVARTKTVKGRVLVREFIKVRRYQIADDGMILDLMRAGRIRVDAESGRVYSLKSNGEEELTQYENQEGGYLFVRLYRGNERKKVAVHRLVMMADMDAEIPAGFDVDHRNKNHRDNRLANLRLLIQDANRCTNLLKQVYPEDF